MNLPDLLSVLKKIWSFLYPVLNILVTIGVPLAGILYLFLDRLFKVNARFYLDIDMNEDSDGTPITTEDYALRIINNTNTPASVEGVRFYGYRIFPNKLITKYKKEADKGGESYVLELIKDEFPYRAFRRFFNKEVRTWGQGFIKERRIEAHSDRSYVGRVEFHRISTAHYYTKAIIFFMNGRKKRVRYSYLKKFNKEIQFYTDTLLYNYLLTYVREKQRSAKREGSV